MLFWSGRDVQEFESATTRLKSCEQAETNWANDMKKATGKISELEERMQSSKWSEIETLKDELLAADQQNVLLFQECESYQAELDPIGFEELQLASMVQSGELNLDEEHSLLEIYKVCFVVLCFGCSVFQTISIVGICPEAPRLPILRGFLPAQALKPSKSKVSEPQGGIPEKTTSSHHYVIVHGQQDKPCIMERR